MTIKTGVPQGSLLVSLFFLIHIGNLSDGLASNPKLFADYASLFFVVETMTKSANDLNNGLAKISSWAFQWIMNFNPDPMKRLFLVETSKYQLSMFDFQSEY